MWLAREQGVGQSTVSRHLKVLGDQGWVRSRRQGTNHLYRTVLDELERRGLSTGLITLCAANGLGSATIIERV